MSDVLQVVTTLGAKADAERLARALVERKLAACVQVSGPLLSCYRWKGQIETAEEWLCTVKTSRVLYPQLEKAIRELHPYENPEILATAVVEGSPDYLRWVVEETSDSPS